MIAVHLIYLTMGIRTVKRTETVIFNLHEPLRQKRSGHLLFHLRMLRQDENHKHFHVGFYLKLQEFLK